MRDLENNDLPKGWTWAKLSDFSDIILGQSPPSSTYNEEQIGLPFYQGKLEFGSIYPTPRKWCSAPKKIAEEGDVLISVRAPVGPTNICPEKSCIGRGLAAIRGLEGIEPFFLLYLIRSIEKEISKAGTGTTFDAINGDQLKSLKLPLSPLPEQYRIVARIEELFSHLDTGVEALQKARAQLQGYRQAVLKAAVEGKLTEEWRKGHPEAKPVEWLLQQTNIKNRNYSEIPDKGMESWNLPMNWQWIKLGICSELTTKGESPKWQGFNYVEQGVTFIRSENVLWGSVDTSKSVKIPLEFHKKLKRSIVKPNDVLINLVGASIGRCGVVPASIQEANINQAVAIIRAKDILVPYYLMYLLISPKMQKQIQGTKVETARPNISLGDLNHLYIPLPPVSEQMKIIDKIEYNLSISNSLHSILENDINRIAHLRQSILKHAFEGKLVSQDTNDEPASLLLERIRAERIKEAPRRGRKSNNNSHQMRLIQ